MAAIKLEKHILLIGSFFFITIIFWITPDSRIEPNIIFICSHILSLTGKNILVIKLGNLSYIKCSGKHKANAIIPPHIFNFSLLILSPINSMMIIFDLIQEFFIVF